MVFDQRPIEEIEASGDLAIAGDRAALLDLWAVLDRFSLWFPLVTP